MDVTNVNSKEIEMHELVIVGSRYSKHLKDRLLPIYEKGEHEVWTDICRGRGDDTEMPGARQLQY